MALTIPPGFRDRGARDWLKPATTTSAITSTSWTMTAPFQAFIAEQCAERARQPFRDVTAVSDCRGAVPHWVRIVS